MQTQEINIGGTVTTVDFAYVISEKDQQFVHCPFAIERAKDVGTNDGSKEADAFTRMMQDQYVSNADETRKEHLLRQLKYFNAGDVWSWGAVAFMQHRAGKSGVQGICREWYYRAFQKAATERCNEIIYSIESHSN